LTACLQCEPGTYQPEEGQDSCNVCGAGSYSSNVLSCELCPVSEYCETGVSVGTRCPVGFTTNALGAKSKSECGCYAGEYEVLDESGNRSCVQCDSNSMVCTEAVLNVVDLPLAPGYCERLPIPLVLSSQLTICG